MTAFAKAVKAGLDTEYKVASGFPVANDAGGSPPCTIHEIVMAAGAA